MSFHPEEIGVWSEPVEFPVIREATVAYAEATNDPIAKHRDGTFAPPVYAVVPSFQAMAERAMSAAPDELIMKILHGKHDFHFHRPIVAGDMLSCRAKVIGIHGKSSGVVVSAKLETTDAEHKLVNEQYFTGFFKGGQFSPDAGETSPDHTFDKSLRERAPDIVAVQKYDEDQTFRYSEAAGDPMPVHLDDDFAKLMGLPGIIIHGLCTMAFTSHALISRVAPDDPQRLKRIAVRFSAPAFPRNMITTSAWRTSDSYSFETVTDDGVALISDGRAVFAN